MDVVNIDGSHGEGGGQIIRNAVTLTCLLRKKLEVVKIRAGRPNPGLASQHLESILALLRLTQASTQSRLEKGVTEFEVDGTTSTVSHFTEEQQQQQQQQKSDGIYTSIDLKTAGSVSLCIQCILPYLLTLRCRSQIKIIGGTHVMKAPNFDYLHRVFLPIMNRFLGYNIDVKMTWPGYYPRGGGVVNLYVNREDSKTNKFNHFHMTSRGTLVEVQAILNLTPKLASRTNDFSQIISDDTRNIEVRTVNYASVEYFCTFQNSYAGFYFLAEGRNPTAEDVFNAIHNVQNDMRNFINSSAVVDSFMQDQLIIYMALAKVDNPSDSSEIRTGPLTDHTTSAIHVTKLFLADKGVNFSVQDLDGGRTFSIKV